LVRIRNVTALALAGLLLLVACGSSSKASSSGGNATTTTTTTTTTSATTTTTASNKGFQLQTDDGQVSLSLNGQLPPNWPSSFPVPSGATAAGSGSLAKGESGVLVGVYTTSQAPADVYKFYKTNPSLTIGTTRSAGAGSAYIGRVELKGSYSGHITVVALNGTTKIVVTLKPTSQPSTTTPSPTTTSTSSTNATTSPTTTTT
jgi:hypothetical protein